MAFFVAMHPQKLPVAVSVGVYLEQGIAPCLHKNLGSGIKTVEFILKYDENSIVFLEAKKSCPNAENRYESEEQEQNFEEYYTSITEKLFVQ